MSSVTNFAGPKQVELALLRAFLDVFCVLQAILILQSFLKLGIVGDFRLKNHFSHTVHSILSDVAYEARDDKPDKKLLVVMLSAQVTVAQLVGLWIVIAGLFLGERGG